jgi:subtilase family serine protease
MMTGPGLGDRTRAYVALATMTVFAAVSVLASGCTSSRSGPPPVSLPVPRTGEVTFYLSLPASTARLDQAAAKAAMPGSSSYRHFTSLATAYGVGTLRAHASGTPEITILDLGGGWRPSDLKLAGQCFGYSPPRVDQMQGDGVATAIRNADPETSLDLQTAAAVAPRARFRLVQSTPGGGGILDAFSRALDDPAGPPDVVSLSYGGCALAENTSAAAFTSVIDAVLAMAALTGVSSFAAAGDSGSTTCGPDVGETTLSYPAVSSFITAVGGTRLTLGKGNARVSERVWNDSAYGVNGAGGGALTRRVPAPPARLTNPPGTC